MSSIGAYVLPDMVISVTYVALVLGRTIAIADISFVVTVNVYYYI